MVISKFIFCFNVIFTEGLAQYSIPKGVQRGIEVDLSDKTYDGVEEEGRLISGLGQLVDGQRGPDNFRSDIFGYGKGKHHAWSTRITIATQCVRLDKWVYA